MMNHDKLIKSLMNIAIIGKMFDILSKDDSTATYTNMQVNILKQLIHGHCVQESNLDFLDTVQTLKSYSDVFICKGNKIKLTEEARGELIRDLATAEVTDKDLPYDAMQNTTMEMI